MHKGRTLLVIVAIAVGLAGAGVILNAWALVEVATTEGFRASDPAAATLRLDVVDSALLARVRLVPGVRDVQARRVTMARASVGGGSVPAMLFTVTDFDAIRIGRVSPKVGQWPPADETLTIETSSVAFSGASLTESVQLAYGAGAPVATSVRGIVRDVTLAPGWMEHLLYGFVSRATLERMGAPATMNELQLVVTDRSLDQDGVRRIAFAAKVAAEATGRRVFDVEVPVPGEHIHAAQMDSLLYTQGAFALMALVLSAFLVVNLISAMLVGQTREIGVMKAIGGRWQQISAMYLVVAAVLGGAAVVLAVPIALVAGRAYAGVKAELLNFELGQSSVPGWVIVLQVAVGVLLPVIAAAFPVWRGCRIPVNDALRDAGIADAGSTGGLAYRVSGLSRPLLFSLRNAFRRRERMALTLLALASGGAVFLGSLNLRASVLGATSAIFDTQHYDFSLRVAEPQAADSLEAMVSAVSGVEAAEAWTGTRATVDHGDGLIGNSIPITAAPADSRMLNPTVLEGRWLRAGDTRALVVNRGAQRDCRRSISARPDPAPAWRACRSRRERVVEHHARRIATDHGGSPADGGGFPRVDGMADAAGGWPRSRVDDGARGAGADEGDRRPARDRGPSLDHSDDDSGGGTDRCAVELGAGDPAFDSDECHARQRIQQDHAACAGDVRAECDGGRDLAGGGGSGVAGGVCVAGAAGDAGADCGSAGVRMIFCCAAVVPRGARRRLGLKGRLQSGSLRARVHHGISDARHEIPFPGGGRWRTA